MARKKIVHAEDTVDVTPDAPKKTRRKKPEPKPLSQQEEDREAMQLMDAVDRHEVVAGLTPRHKLKVVHAGIKSLRPYENNPRKGNVAAIADSLQQNGQYKPIVVQRRTRRVLAGNHTLQAAKALGWTHVDVVYVDCDEEQAARIVLADNRTNDLATYDMEMLDKVLGSLPDVAGTGYSQRDLDRITQAAADVMVSPDEIREIFHPDFDEQEEHLPSLTHIFDADIHEPDDPHTSPVEVFMEPDVVEEADFELAGNLVLKPDLEWYGKTRTFFDIPVLSRQNLVTPEMLPESIRTYVPRLHRDWPDDDQGWLLISRSGNTAGLKQPQNSIMAFYTFDEYFEAYWEQMSIMTSKLINARIGMAVTPNYSQFGDRPFTQCLWSLFKSRYVARYWQEAGINVIPDVGFALNDPGLAEGNSKCEQWMTQYVLPTYPDHIPVVAMQRHAGTANFTPEVNEQYDELLTIFYDEKKPEVCLLYANDEGYERVQSVGLGWDIIQIKTFADVMHGFADAQKERAEIENRLGQ